MLCNVSKGHKHCLYYTFHIVYAYVYIRYICAKAVNVWLYLVVYTWHVYDSG